RLHRQASENYGALHVSEPYESPLSGHTLAYMMPITNPYQEVKGTAIAEVNLDLLTTNIAPLIFQSFALITADGNAINRLLPGEKLLPVQPATYPLELQVEFAANLPDLKVGVDSVSFGEE